MTDNHAVKLILTYDVIAETVQEYYQFVMGQYIPVMQSLGFELIEAWTHAYSADESAPGRIVSFACAEGDKMDELLLSDNWEALNEQLGQFVENFQYKFVTYRAGIQI